MGVESVALQKGIAKKHSVDALHSKKRHRSSNAPEGSKEPATTPTTGGAASAGRPWHKLRIHLFWEPMLPNFYPTARGTTDLAGLQKPASSL